MPGVRPMATLRIGRSGAPRVAGPGVRGRGRLAATEPAASAGGDGREGSSEAAETAAAAAAVSTSTSAPTAAVEVSPMQAALEFVARDRPDVFGVDLGEAPGEPLKTGESPETLNGRAAMVGFVGGGIAEAATGQTLGEQLSGHLPEVAAFALFLVLASLAPALRAEFSNQGLGDEDEPEWRLFTPAAEKVHARIAMVAITVQVALESLTGRPLF